MRHLALGLLLGGLLAPMSRALAADERCRGSVYTGDLTALFVAPRELGSDWDSVRESPSNPADDPELDAAGVSATRSLHYTRARPGGSEVCSLEIWSFTTGAAARRARVEIARPGWRLDSHGNLLLMTRGVSFSHADGFHPGLLPECHRLADLSQARASELALCRDAPAAEPAARRTTEREE
jgi:hypothetical protein